jgi:hypothetical protein
LTTCFRVFFFALSGISHVPTSSALTAPSAGWLVHIVVVIFDSSTHSCWMDFSKQQQQQQQQRDR